MLAISKRRGNSKLHHHAEGCREPDGDENVVAGEARQPVDRQRRIGRRDHDEDRRVIEPAQDVFRRAVGGHHVVSRRETDHRQQARAIDRNADHHRQPGDVRQQPETGIDGENDADHMDHGVGGMFVARIKPVDAPDGVVHRAVGGLVQLMDGLVHRAIIATKCGATMNSAQPRGEFRPAGRDSA